MFGRGPVHEARLAEDADTRLIREIVREMMDELREEMEKKKGKHHATVEDAEDSKEDRRARKRPRTEVHVVRNEADVGEEFELDVECTPGQPGITPVGLLNLRNSREKKVRLLGDMSMVIACKDDPVIFDVENGRIVIRDRKNQDIIHNEDDETEQTFDNGSSDDDSSSSSSSDSSGSYLGELQVPPSPPETSLPAHLIPARMSKSGNNSRRSQNTESANQKRKGASTKSSKRRTLNTPRPTRPIHSYTLAELMERFPEIPSTPRTPARETTS